MHERDAWAGVLAALLAVLIATTPMAPRVWVTAAAVLAGGWALDRHLGLDGGVAVLLPVFVGTGFLLFFRTPPEQMFLNGVVRSGILALGAVGLTLVYGILNLVNFAHGDLLTAGGYFAWLVATPVFGVAAWQLGGLLLVPLASVLLWELLSDRVQASDGLTAFAAAAALAAASWVLAPHGRWVALGLVVFGVAAWTRLGAGRMQGADRATLALGCLAVGAVVGIDYAFQAFWAEMVASLGIAAATVAALSIGLDRVLWTRLRDRDANLLTLMIVSIGVAFALRSSIQLAFGGDIRVFFQEATGQSWTARYYLSLVGLGDLRVTQIDVWIVGTTLVSLLATGYVMQRTRVGKAMRALADDMDLARVAGIDTERVVTYVWLLGGALAGIAGALLAMETSLNGELGWRALLPLFSVVILGGVGSVPGALLGGLVIGMAEALSVHWLNLAGLDTSYNVAVGFLILIVTLILRPRGIMGVDPT